MIYLDNASTTIHKPKEVIDSVVYALSNIGNTGRGVNNISVNSARLIYNVREKISKFFNIEDSSRISFTSNATDALNIVIKGLFDKNDHIITTEVEHNSVLRPLYELQKTGTELTILTKEEVLKFKEDTISQKLKNNTKAIICTHASNLTGDILDVKNIGKFCKKNNILFILDVAQTAGIIPIDVKKLNIDILCFTGHKGLMGPQGTGGIYVKTGIEIKSFKTGGSGVNTYSKTHPDFMPEKLEAGTLNGHGILGLGAGIDFINKIGIETIFKKEEKLMLYFYNKLQDLNNKNIKIYGNFFENNQVNQFNLIEKILLKRIPIICLNIGDLDSNEICEILNDEYNIIVRSGGHCAPLMHKSLGTVEQGAIRFSFSYFNTIEEIEKVMIAIKEILNYL